MFKKICLFVLLFQSTCFAISREYNAANVVGIKQDFGNQTFPDMRYGAEIGKKAQFAVTFKLWENGTTLIPVNAEITAVKIQYSGTCPALKCGLLNNICSPTRRWSDTGTGFNPSEYSTLFDTFTTTTTTQTKVLSGAQADWIIERFLGGENIPIVIIGNDSNSVARVFGTFKLIIEYNTPPPVVFHIHSPLGVNSRLGNLTANITLSAPLPHNLVLSVSAQPVEYEFYNAVPARIYNQNVPVEDTDFSAVSWTVLIPAGDTVLTDIPIPVNPDGYSQYPRSFKLHAQISAYSNINTTDTSDQTTVLGGRYGDVNFDGKFDTSDMLIMFQAGKYETGQIAGWEDGDMDGDQLFTTNDLIVMLQEGVYEQGAAALAADIDANFGE